MYDTLARDTVKVKFDDIQGLEDAKKIIYECLIYPSKRPDIFTGLRAPARGLLMYGPPGNGKTLVAKAIANEGGFKFFNISSSVLISKFVGDSEKMIKSLFHMARLSQPSVRVSHLDYIHRRDRFDAYQAN